jgi:hypothetical protein
VLWKPITDKEMKHVLDIIKDMRSMTVVTALILETQWARRIQRYINTELAKRHHSTKKLVYLFSVDADKIEKKIDTIYNKPTAKFHRFEDHRVYRWPRDVPFRKPVIAEVMHELPVRFRLPESPPSQEGHLRKSDEVCQ